MARLLGVTAMLCVAAPANAASPTERLAADSRAGRPLIAHVFVALCDNANQGIVPVPARLGNGQSPAENLYWGARFGVKSYFGRAKGWKRVPLAGTRPRGVLERIAFRRETTGTRLFVIADAWDGARIRETLGAFLEAAAGRARETVEAGGERLPAGGDAHVVAYVGHTGLMELEAPELGAGRPDPPRAAIVLACASRPYFLEPVGRAQAYPLLLTTGLMAPEAYSLEAALRVWFATGDARQARRAAADAYDEHQDCGRPAARRLFAAE